MVTIAVFGEEIIKISTLETLAKEKKEFSIERDIFSPFKRISPKPGERVEQVIQPPLLEPVMILVMGGIVLLIVLAILLPIIEINQLVR